MNVMYTCDNNYVWLMGISVISLFENNKDIIELNVYLLGEKIDDFNKEKLNKIGLKYNRTVKVIDVPEIDIPQSLVSARWPVSAFTRLFSGMILPQNIDRILYLDCDTIITGDISQLDFVSFNGNVIMGVKDCISGAYKNNIGLDKNQIYINAGVVLFDMKLFRMLNIKQIIDDYMKNYENIINYADQDILNGILNGKIGELHPKYNVMTIDVVYSYKDIIRLRKPTNFYNEILFDEAKTNPSIVHYTTNMRVIRPWYRNTNHPLAEHFQKYMQKSEWKNRKLDMMKFSSKEMRIVFLIMKLPKCIAYNILGYIHAELKPKYMRMKARR